MREKSLLVVFASLGALAIALASPAYGADAGDHSPVTCKDGTASHTGKDGCDHHGGVTQGGASAAAHEKKGEASDHPTVKCKDGTTAANEKHSGACAQHGGVAEGADKGKDDDHDKGKGQDKGHGKH